MEYNFESGKRLILELNTGEIFEGDFADGGKNRIDMVNVMQNENNNKLGGIYSFYRNEIKNIRTMKTKSTPKESDDKPCENGDKAVAGNSKQITIVEDEYDRLKDMSANYIYMENADNRYYDAVSKLIENESIGVVALGLENDRVSTIKLLALSNWKQVYIFDLANQKGRSLWPELKEVLESSYITKVVHGGAQLIDCLYHGYGVHMQNVFDTQVVDLVITKKETGGCGEHIRNISECLSHYFNFPTSLLKEAIHTSQKKWTERPIKDQRKLYASQLATYLLTLRDHQQSILLRSVYSAIDNVHNLFINSTNYEFKRKLNNLTCHEISDFIPQL